MRTGSLCTGYGGLDLAVHAVLGGELTWVADTDPGAAAILAHRFPSAPNLGDISQVNWSLVEPTEILTAGFPCQDVSCAGARTGMRAGTRTGVWSYVAKAVGVLRPSLVLLENVRGLLSAGADSDMEFCPWCLGETGDEHALRAAGAVLGDLADLGFDAGWTTLSASEGGAPHRRERVFILAWPAADPRGGELQRRGIAGVLGGAPAGEPGEGDQRERAGDAAGGGPGAAEDADRAASGQRRVTAPGQAEGRRPRADAGGPGGAPAADAERGTGNGRAGEPLRGPHRRTAAVGHSAGRGERDAAADTERDGQPGRTAGTPGETDERREGPRAEAAGRGRSAPVTWGPYGAAIARWEAVLGRPAPRPTVPGKTAERLNPAFAEWMMGLPAGWVTDVPGLSRNAMLKALGNGVVPQQAELALRLLLDRAELASPEAAA